MDDDHKNGFPLLFGHPLRSSHPISLSPQFSNQSQSLSIQQQLQSLSIQQLQSLSMQRLQYIFNPSLDLLSSSSSSSSLMNHGSNLPAFNRLNQQSIILQEDQKKVNDEMKMEDSDDERNEVISPKTAEKMAKEMDRKRPGSQGENGDGLTRRPRGRPRIYGMNREEINEKKGKEENGDSEHALRSDQDSPIDPSLHDFADGTKRRKYAPNLVGKFDFAKDDPKYLDMRRANNEAVKRNRDKAKRLQMLKDQELERLRQTVITLEKELLEEKDQNKRLNAQIDTYKQILDAFASTRPPNVQ